MKKEIKIILEPNIHKSKNGNVFEDLVRHILEKQGYKITKNIHITGLEIDLFAKHSLSNQILYAECKAKIKPKSSEIKNFVYTIDYGIDDEKADLGYFIHTEELDKQAAGLKLQIENNKKNISFIGPVKIIDSLVNANIVNSFNHTEINDLIISKLTLAYTYFGIYYVALLSDGSIPKYFTIFNKNITTINDSDIIQNMKDAIPELQNMNYKYGKEEHRSKKSQIINRKDTISEIRESENWFDYTPASIKHFIGRTKLKREIKGFIENVRTLKTKNRIFFIDGKSGWGKSSLIAELKGSSHTLKYWKNRMHVLAVDTRSANTINFVGLAFQKLVNSAIQNNFIKSNIFNTELRITSPLNVLDDESVKELFVELKKRKKVLVLVFDQFEDKFRNENLFNAFYQFCIDTNELKENLVVGFSWKSEINIPIGNPTYHKFNQLKDYAKSITVPEFNQSDAKKVVKQLEKSIMKSIGNDLERRLIESSQGYPWLIKKLCIHTLNQYKKGKTIEELLEQELNYKELFENDLLDVNSEEKKLLDHIAKRAYNGNPFDISELEKETQILIDQLIHKRLVIRTGTTYNIYWDIFRDYIVTKEIPVIGENYLIRQSGNTCLDTFLIFQRNKKMKLSELIEAYPKDISEKAILNILLELRRFGLIKKEKGIDIFEITEKVDSVSKDFFQKYITEKFKNYTPYIELMKLEKSNINTDDIKEILKTIFKTEKFEENTWHAYAKQLAIWFSLSNLTIKERLSEIRKGKSYFKINFKKQIPYYSPATLMKSYEEIQQGKTLVGRKNRDLFLFGLIGDDNKLHSSVNNIEKHLFKSVLKMDKIRDAYLYLKNNLNLTQNDLITQKPNLVRNNNTITSKKQAISIIYSWARYCIAFESGKKLKLHYRKQNQNYYYTNSPNQAIATLMNLAKGKLDLNQNNKRKLRDLENLGIVELSNSKDYILSNIGKKLVNSPNPDKILADEAKKDLNINRFLTYCLNETDSAKIEYIIKKEKAFFSNFKSHASKRVKCSIYYSWAKFIRRTENRSL